MVCHIGGQLGTKVVISALGMLALYMCFNGTGIWGGETLSVVIVAGVPEGAIRPLKKGIGDSFGSNIHNRNGFRPTCETIYASQ